MRDALWTAATRGQSIALLGASHRVLCVLMSTLQVYDQGIQGQRWRPDHFKEVAQLTHMAKIWIQCIYWYYYYYCILCSRLYFLYYYYFMGYYS